MPTAISSSRLRERSDGSLRCHSGAPRSGEPGIQSGKAVSGSGFRVHALTRVPRNDGWIEMAKNTKTKSKKTRKVDPVIAEIVRNGVLAVTEEMKTNLMRTAYNMIIYEALDFTTGLFTPEGETVSIGIGLPTFIRGMAETVKAKIKHFGGIKNMHPGDIYVTNDSYTTGSHLNHFTFTLPIFHKGKLA